MEINKYKNLAKTINELNKRGFSRKFNFNNGKIFCPLSSKRYVTDEIEIVEYHRFKPNRNQSESTMIIALDCKDGEKGYIISTDKNYQSIPLKIFLDKVNIKPRNHLKIPHNTKLT